MLPAKKKAEAAKAKKPAPAKAKKPAPAKAKNQLFKRWRQDCPSWWPMKLAVMPSKGNASKTKKELKSKIERRTAKGKSADKAKAELKSKRKTDRKINKFRDQVAGTRRAQAAAKRRSLQKAVRLFVDTKVSSIMSNNTLRCQPTPAMI